MASVDNNKGNDVSTESKGKSVLENLMNTAENVATLNITTVVGEAIPVKGKDGYYLPDKTGKTMHSSIDLLQGDITSIIPQAFLSPPLSTIRQYHQAREDTGRQIIKENIECLMKLVELVKELAKPDK